MSPLASLPVAVNVNGVLTGIVKLEPALTVGTVLPVAEVASQAAPPPVVMNAVISFRLSTVK